MQLETRVFAEDSKQACRLLASPTVMPDFGPSSLVSDDLYSRLQHVHLIPVFLASGAPHRGSLLVKFWPLEGSQEQVPVGGVLCLTVFNEIASNPYGGKS